MQSEITRQVDALMQRLYRYAAGRFVQPLLAAYAVADCWRNHLQPDYVDSNRLIVRMAKSIWHMLLPLGFAAALRLSFFIWFMIGLPLLLRQCLRLHVRMFTGELDRKIILLRTGVSNEPNIAKWLSDKHGGEAVSMLSVNEQAAADITAVRHLPGLIVLYTGLTRDLMRLILEMQRNGEIDEVQCRELPPVWLVLLGRTAPSMCAVRRWAELYLQSQSQLTHLYFTMNSILEASFMAALPEVQHAYVEHGFPRRDIPPLACKQYVYGKQYADYLRSFDAAIEIEEIGIDYFPKAEIGDKTRTIVVASLQDWPQWGIQRVAERFNKALATAKANDWCIIFRGRNYDEDAFAQGLRCDWDEISNPKQESFAQCLQRVKPTMVWTTWSTAVLDAEAMGVLGVCFIDDALSDYFIPDYAGSIVDVISDGVLHNKLLPQLTGEMQ